MFHSNYASALDDFRRQRRTAALQMILSRLTGKPAELLSFEDVSRQLKYTGGSDRGLEDIPLDSIIGSVGRYTDFTRSFLPRQESDRERWARVKATLLSDPAGLPPIEAYKIGNAYFVRDGHHRVSVARQLKATHIQGYVTEVRTKVPLTADVSPDELILKAEFADFLQHTHFDELLPGVELKLTVPGLYQRLEEHIHAHQYFMGIDQKRPVSLDEAVVHWYENVYLPVVQAIQERGTLREFPGRTETDLYFWISEHRYLLEKEMGWQVRSDIAATSLANRMSPRPQRIVQRITRKLLDTLVPYQLEDIPSTGQWRQGLSPDTDCLFRDILVTIGSEESGWTALDQAFVLARCSDTVLHGLHVVPTASLMDDPIAHEIQGKFDQRCNEAGIPGHLVIAQGDVAHQVCDRALVTDLVILNVAHPPSDQIVARLESGLRTIIRRCARPILAVPEAASPIDRLILAYDGSAKSKEALYISAYLAGKQKMPLTVVTIAEVRRTSSKTIREARKYLESRGVKANYRQEKGPVASCLLQVAQETHANLILMGGYGFSPMVEVVLGSTVDRVLREANVPVLICQ